uniref:Xaa-Pro aminopeptidase P n=1 Tax=Chenopodium quinoa TaxID=63459 RepID=A0A803KVX7_CHEQI
MADKLSALRSLMASHSPPLHALIVPSEDYHQSEYVSDRDKRRKFISGFSGSAGLALITTDDARLWTDGRYFLQAEKQLSDQWKLMRMGEDPAVEIWMADNLPEEAAIGIDPWSVSIDTAQRWERALEKKQQKLISTSNNLVDQIWNDRPEAKVNPVKVQPLEFAGRTVAEKLQDLRRKLMQEKAHSIIISALDEVAWLFNIRGSDVSYCPVVHAFAVVTSAATFFYADQQKVSPEVQTYMMENKIEVRDYDAVGADVDLLAFNQLASSLSVNAAENKSGEMGKDCNFIWMDPRSCCYALYSKLKSDQVLLQQSPLALAKALKNPAEMEGLKKAHVRDGAAVVQFLVWLDKQMQEAYGAPGYFSEAETERKKPSEAHKLTEVSVSDKLEGFRASKEHFRGLSFPTISSVGPNAAIIHYGPDPQTCAEMDPDRIYLFDSGAQYQDGTTDITRTVHFGQPSAHEKACYTGVLKGHIALGDARFPKGTNGPHLISFRPQAQNVPLQAAMTVTDEPGYYEDGNFGIRLENVLIVNEANTEFNFGDRGYLEFEHITWAPYQHKLINLSLLTPEEISWLNTYHSRCREILTPYMNDTEMAWLIKATEPIDMVMSH